MTTSDLDHRNAPDKFDVMTADEFNLWCALNGKPYRLARHVWPDGRAEWDVEVDPGKAEGMVCYGTGREDEAVAAAAAFAFIAGVEWAEAATRARMEDEILAGEEADDDYEGEEDMPAAPLAANEDDADLAAVDETDADDDAGEVEAEGGLEAVDDDAEDADGTASGAFDESADAVDGAPVLEVDAEAEIAAEAGPADDGDEEAAPAAWDEADDGYGNENGAAADDDEDGAEGYDYPPLALLGEPDSHDKTPEDEQKLADNARTLETVLKNFRVRGEIMEVKVGPVVTLYELEPVPGTKSATIINLADDIARSMSAVTARIAVVPGRSVIGIELPNETRETVYLREIMDSDAFQTGEHKLPLALGKDIGGKPTVVDLARMPHLLIAGTTGSGKSVGINGMILSLLYHLPPEKCRLIMVDPKMLELSVYDGIPHLLTPVVTDPKKAVQALKWAVREMESRYKAMATLGVRNIEGYNARVAELVEKGERVMRQVQVGFDRDRREPIYEEQPMDLRPLPYIVIVVDEMADLMLVAGKEIEAAIQRLAQMARAAGIHLIMATQRPSVDVITGTIKANFPTRISFMVTSKIDSRTILGEAGAEQLLGQGDMLYMKAGGRITRVHGPFVADSEVEKVVRYLKDRGEPEYLHTVTEEDGMEAESLAPDMGGNGGGGGAGAGVLENLPSSGDDLYDQALALVLREQKVSVSFIQRHLQIGYNRSARLVERMENEGVVSPANHVGKREILVSAASLYGQATAED
ncbi:Cell division protein FtsK [Caenispirillum salinarum AK4]|uniref:Cell division protein FtsK n=1 Tax=Caenispirillum salinarum AK4 TaxID=1238182 RepID=K9GNN7_9PROT|nr:DNA translocase FtsK [Caenispirillum salinarum]EKV27570.1 Cell division protein FtsK [Caenispirillum salinarum AK4]